MRKKQKSVVLAWPGTGKTKILEGVVEALVTEDGVRPQEILLITFTRAGADNMRKRIPYPVNIHTFHSFALRIIKDEKDIFRNRIDPIDDIDSYDPETDDLLKKMEGLGFLVDDFGSLVAVREAYDEAYPELSELRSSDRNHWLKDLRKEIGRVRVSYGWDVDGYVRGLEERLLAIKSGLAGLQLAKPTKTRQTEMDRLDRKIARNKEMSRIYRGYVERVRGNRKLDFDDILSVFAAELIENPTLLEKLRSKYKYVLVDEYQDTNPAQERILGLINPVGCLMMVGDEKQSIFSFQWADPKIIVEKANRCDSVRLTDNYRSTQAILDVANSVLWEFSTNGGGASFYTFIGYPILNARAGHDEKSVKHALFDTEAEEDTYVVAQIKSAIANGTKPDEIAVIYRNNRHGENIAKMLRDEGIPFTASFRNRTNEDPKLGAVVDLVAHAFMRGHVPEPVRYQAMRLLSPEPDSVDRFFIETRDIPKTELPSGKFTNDLYRFVSGLEPDYSTYRSVRGLIEEIASRIPTELPEVEREDILKHLETVKRFASRYASEEPKKVGARLRLAREIEYDFGSIDVVSGKDNEPKVKLTTAHGSKGLEFDKVFVIRSTDKGWKKGKKAEMFAEKEDTSFEDANLYYVALTRAKKELIITSAPEGARDSISEFVTYPSVDTLLEKTSPEVQVEIKLSSETHETVTRDKRISEFIANSEKQRKGIDFTKFSTFHKDKQRFYEKYVLGLMEDSTPAIAYGNMVHEAIERAAKNEGWASLVDTAEIFRKYSEIVFINKEWKEERRAAFDANSMLDLVEKWEKFTNKIFLKMAITGLHESEFVSVVDGIKLYGKIDSIEEIQKESDTTIVSVRDYKTGRAKTLNEAMKEDGEFSPWRGMVSQLLYYKILVESGEARIRGGDGKFKIPGKLRVENGIFTFFDVDEWKVSELVFPMSELAELETQIRADIRSMVEFGKA